MLAEFDRALDYLESAIAQSNREGLDWVKVDTDLDPLRPLPRYVEMLAAVEARLADRST